MRTKLILLSIIGVLLLGGGFGWRYFTAPVPQDLQVTRTTSGGFTGDGDSQDRTIINGRLTTPQATRQLSDTELKELVRRVNQAHFFNLAASFGTRTCADAIIATLHITMNQQTHEVTFEDCGSDTPQALLELDNYVRLLQ